MSRPKRKFQAPHPAEVIGLRLASLGCAPQTAADRAAIDKIIAAKIPARGGTVLSAAGSDAAPRLLLTGWACRQRVLTDGGRLIFSLLLPGDIISGRIATGQPSIAALTAVTTAEIPVEDARGVLLPCLDPERSAAREESLLLNQIMRLGRQTAYERMAHLLLELRQRLSVVGLVEDETFPMPMTQEMLADMLGLSLVHVNRTLQQMRREGLIELTEGHVTLHQLDQLSVIADFAPSRR